MISIDQTFINIEKPFINTNDLLVSAYAYLFKIEIDLLYLKI